MVSAVEASWSLEEDPLVSSDDLAHMVSEDEDLYVKVAGLDVDPSRALAPLRLEEEAVLGGTSFPPGTYVDNEGLLSEFYVGSLLSGARKECANFLKVVRLVTKVRGGVVWQNIVMERAASDVFRRDLGYDEAFGAFVQVLFAIAFYQEKFRVSHNDLHLGNLLVFETKPGTKFGEEDLHEADWFRYVVGDKEVFVPNHGFVVKVGDFGRAVRHTERPIGSGIVFGQKKGRLTPPNVFTPSYDPCFLAMAFRVDSSTSPELDEVLDLFLPDGIWHEGTIYRPRREFLRKVPTAKAVLRGGVLQRICGRRPQGKVATLGVL